LKSHGFLKMQFGSLDLLFDMAVKLILTFNMDYEWRINIVEHYYYT